jgi:hypothetical protein
MLAKVHHLEAEWRRVLASVSDCLWSAEFDADGQWVYRYLSPVVGAIAGRQADDFLDGRVRWLDVVHPADRPAIEAAERELGWRPGYSIESMADDLMAIARGQAH